MPRGAPGFSKASDRLRAEPHTERASQLRGYAYVAGATILWGLSAVLGRAVFTGRLLTAGQALQPIDPLILSQSRTTLSFLVLLPILLVSRGGRSLTVPPRDAVRLALLGVVGVAGSNYFYYLAIERTSVATAIVIQYTAPIWVLIYMLFRRVQRPTASRIAAVGLAVAGSALAVGAFRPGAFRVDPTGLAAALVSALTFAFYNLVGHDVLRRHDRWTALLYALGSAAMFWAAVDPPWRLAAAHYGGGQWLFLAVFAITSALLPFSLYFGGLQRLDATRTIVASCLEPVFAILFAAVCLGELVGPLQAVGIGVVLAAIVVAQSPDSAADVRAAAIDPME
jgi:drug/metabolite transporter (DMT)-like permease